MKNAGLDEAKARIKIARRNTNNLKIADDTTCMAQSKEKLKGFLIKVKEESVKADLTLNIQRTKIMATVTMYRDFGAQENKVCHCFHCFPIYLP